MPTALGYIKVKAPSGILKLRLISVFDASVASNGMVKVRMPGTLTNPGVPITLAADLVPPSDLGSYPVRVRTPKGVFKWRTGP